MDILWPALGIAAIVVFVFYVLAQYWQRLLRQQAWTIRKLFDRVQSLEQMADPVWRRRLSEATPLPLEQVFTFSFNLGDRFWRETICMSEEDRRFIRESGCFVGSVKLERWRSHTVATITEVLPDRRSTGWQTRSLDFYSDTSTSSEALSLWELALARPRMSIERPPSLELLLRANAIELRGHFVDFGKRSQVSGNGQGAAADAGEVIFFRVPLDSASLAEFRSQDPADASGKGNSAVGRHQIASSWQAFYFHHDEETGIDWQLRLRDLSQKSEWEQWQILESPAVPVATRE
ncbi:MAG: hypothetical protein WCC21_09130 [Candidatus Acidiferrales bacterium]